MSEEVSNVTAKGRTPQVYLYLENDRVSVRFIGNQNDGVKRRLELSLVVHCITGSEALGWLDFHETVLLAWLSLKISDCMVGSERIEVD